MTGQKLTPLLMTGSLFLGLLLAIIHHFYYEFLNGKVVKNQSQQEWFFRVGTGIAFLARAFLSAAVGFAYTQILWRTLRCRSITIQGINSLFGILHNAWEFTTWELWTRASALAVVGMIAWALPLIAVITPATLTVQVASFPNETIVNAPLPILDYDNASNFAQMSTQVGVTWSTPSNYVSRVLLSVASLGSILTIPAPFPNSSYAVDFYGPELSCDTPKNTSFAKVVSDTVHNSTCCGKTVGYIGFIPTSPRGGPLINHGVTEEEYALAGLQDALNTSILPTISTLDTVAKDTGTSKFYVVVPVRPRPRGYILANKTIECRLYNSSFAVNFTFHNGQQDISYKSKRLNGVSASSCDGQWSSRCRAVFAYISLMDTLGKLLLGSLYTFDHSGSMLPVRTQIMSSILMDSKEMQDLRAVNTVFLSDRPETPESVIGNISMSDALEELFTNATISLFSNPKLLQNSTAASRGPITYLSSQIAFSYKPRNLLIAYGLGLFAVAIVVIIGLLCIKSASASYGSSFSTILRTTRNPDLDTIIPAEETSGAEPLSSHLSNIRLVLRHRKQRLESFDEDTMTFFDVDSTQDEVTDMRRQSANDSLLQRDREHQHSGVSIELSTNDGYSAVEIDDGDGNIETCPSCH